MREGEAKGAGREGGGWPTWRLPRRGLGLYSVHWMCRLVHLVQGRSPEHRTASRQAGQAR